MSEQGGTANQSGVSYQDYYGVQRIAEMLSGQDLPPHEKIVSVRVEAPVEVDDVVVTYEDGHRDYVQAKENLSASGEKWLKVWRQLLREFEKPPFDRNQSRLILCVGNSDADFVGLQEMFDSVEGRQNFGEWLSRLRKSAKLWELWQNKIEKLFDAGKPLASVSLDKWAFLQCVRVHVRLRDLLRRNAILSLPLAQNDNGFIQAQTLFSHLLTFVFEGARNRVEHTFASLSNKLEADHRVHLLAPPPLKTLLDAMTRCGATLRGWRHEFGLVAGSHIARPVAQEIVTWLLSEANGDKNIAVLLDGPGRGKTVVLRDVMVALEGEDVVTLAIKADRQLSDLAPGRHLHDCTGVGLPAPVEDVVRWVARAQPKPVIVLLDQVDALSLSMSRDPYALESIAHLVERLRGLPHVRVLLSCRTFDLNTTPRLRDLDIKQRFQLPDLIPEEISSVLTHFGIPFEELAPATQKLLRVPLHLDLFARIAAKSKDAGHNQPTGQWRGARTLQDLYHEIWDYSILSPDAPVPPEDRTEVIRRMVARMEEDERTSAPFFLFESPDAARLGPAVLYLESEGILQKEGGSNWNFLHQTFYDYAFARFFVASPQSLAQRVIESPQGLVERPLLQHVLGFLRSLNPQDYERELTDLGLDEFFEHPQLRKHLRHLLRQWFGSLAEPNDIEWRHARKMLRQPEHRVQFLQNAGRSDGWFSRLMEEHIPRWLRELESGRLDAASENALFWFLISLADSPVAQPHIAVLLAPYLDRNEQWNNRLMFWTGYIRQWNSRDAIGLYGELLLRSWDKEKTSLFVYHLRDIAKQHPSEGCRLLRQILSTATPALPDDDIFWATRFWSAFADQESGGLKIDDEVVGPLAEATPDLFLQSVWEFFVRILQLRQIEEEPKKEFYYRLDAFRETWAIRGTRGVMHGHHFGFALSAALGKALQRLAETDAALCKAWLAKLQAIPSQTPQMLALDVYARNAPLFAEDALEFLCGDPRRLELGELQCETRRLLRAVVPLWSPAQCAEMERAILKHDRLPYEIRAGLQSLWSLRRRGIEQWSLLRAMGREQLTLDGKRRLREWDDKFRGQKLPDEPITGEGGIVHSPIEGPQSQKMSDRAWLRAMAHYQGDITHRREFLKGGAQQLSRVLQERVKEQPERFTGLFLSDVSLEGDVHYVCALLDGLAASSASGELLFEAVRRFRNHQGEDIFGELPKTIADVLGKRAEEGLPDDMLALMQSWVDDVPPGHFDETFYARQMEGKDVQPQAEEDDNITEW